MDEQGEYARQRFDDLIERVNQSSDRIGRMEEQLLEVNRRLTVDIDGRLVRLNDLILAYFSEKGVTDLKFKTTDERISKLESWREGLWPRIVGVGVGIAAIVKFAIDFMIKH